MIDTIFYFVALILTVAFYCLAWRAMGAVLQMRDLLARLVKMQMPVYTLTGANRRTPKPHGGTP